MTQLKIIDDKKQIIEKKSVISACNVDYRLKHNQGMCIAGDLKNLLISCTDLECGGDDDKDLVLGDGKHSMKID